MKLFQRQFAKCLSRPGTPWHQCPVLTTVQSKLVQATDRWKVGNKVHNAMFFVEREESPLLVTCSYREGLVCVFSINAGKCKEVHHFGGLFTSVIQHHNTLFIAKETAGKQNYIVSFHVPTRACRYRYVGHTHRITDLVINASVLYSTSADTTCCLWQLSDTEDNPFCVSGPSPLSFIDVSERRRSMFIGETPGRPLTGTSPRESSSLDGTALHGEAGSGSNSKHGAVGMVLNGDSKQRDNAGGEGGDGEHKKDISQGKDERRRDDEEHRQDPGVSSAIEADQCPSAAAGYDAAVLASAVDEKSASMGERVVMEGGTGDHTESTDEELSASTSDSLLMAGESDASTSDDGFVVGDDVLQVGEDEEEDGEDESDEEGGEEESDGDDIEEGDEWHPNRSAQPPPESENLGAAETTSGTSLPSSAKPQGASKSRRQSTRARMVPVSPFRVLRGHRCPIACVAVSARSLYQPTTAYTGSTDGTICIWNAETEEHLHTLRNHAGPISTLSVQSYRGRYVLYSASLDGTVRCWDAEDGDELQVYDLGGPVSSLKIGRSCFYAILLNQIIACNIKTGKWENRFTGHVHLIRDWYADAYQIITVSNDGTIRRWDRKTAECLQVFVGHKSPVISLTVPTGSSAPQLIAEQPTVLPSSFYSCGEDSTIQQWPLSKLSDDDAVDQDFSPLRTAVEHDDAASGGTLRVPAGCQSPAQRIKAGERENISVRFEECKPLPAEDFQLEDTTGHDVRIAHYGETERSYPGDVPVRKKKKTSYALLNRSFSLSSLGGSRPKRRTAPSERRNERVSTYTAEWKGGSGQTRSSPSFSHEPLLIGCRLPTLSAADELLSDSRPPPSSPAPRRPVFDRGIASADDIVRVDAAPST